MTSVLSGTHWRVNYWIQCGCAGISTAVFLAWQYGIRDGTTTLVDPEIWRGLDARLPRNAPARVRAFLDENFLLRVGDDRQTPWTLMTSAFSHISVGHFLANFFSFSTVCTGLSIMLPPVHLIGLILTTGLGGSAGFLAQQSRTRFPNRRVRALGMSGITTGLGVALAVLFPQGWVRVYGHRMPNWVALLGYLSWDVFLLPSETSNIGHAAHIGGAVAGLLYASSLRIFDGTYIPSDVLLGDPKRLRELLLHGI